MADQSEMRRARISTPGFAALICLLGFAVFAWGLHYKLSLYHSNVSASQPAPAKLLSNQERPASEVVSAPPDGTSLVALSILCLLLAPLRLLGAAVPFRRRRVALGQHRIAGPLFKRPPPFLLPSLLAFGSL